MRFRDSCPHWATLPTESLLKQAGFDVLNSLLPRIADWYKAHLPMWAVLQHFGYNGYSDSHGGPRYPLIGPDTDMMQVSCQLPNHGGSDSAPSARYYREDRNDNTAWGHIYCWGSHCQKAYTSFWYCYVMLHYHRDFRYADVILYIEQHFGVPFPRDILLNADPETIDNDADTQTRAADLTRRFAQARMLREQLKPKDKAQWLMALGALYTQAPPTPNKLSCAAVTAP